MLNCWSRFAENQKGTLFHVITVISGDRPLLNGPGVHTLFIYVSAKYNFGRQVAGQ
jgi:hypothetical protein